MKFHHCRVKHNPPETYGDCLRACVASIIGVNNPEEVPHFADDGADGDVVLSRMRGWLNNRDYGFFVAHFPAMPMEDFMRTMNENNPDTPYMLFGETLTGENHVIIIQGGEILHNPAWYGGNNLKPIDGAMWQVAVIAVS